MHYLIENYIKKSIVRKEKKISSNFIQTRDYIPYLVCMILL